MRELLNYVRHDLRALVVGLVVSLIASAAALAQPLAAQAVVDALDVKASLAVPTVVLACLVLVSVIAAGCSTWLIDRTGERVVLSIRRRLAFRFTRLRIDELDRWQHGELTARATSDSNAVRIATTTGFVRIADGGIALAAGLVLMVYLDIRLAASAVVVLAIVGIAVALILPRIRAAARQGQDAVGTMGAAFDGVLGAARTVKANAAEVRFTASIDAASEYGYRAGLRGARYNAVVTAVSELSLQVAFLVVLALGGALVAAGSLPVSTLVAFLLTLFYLANPIVSLSAGVSALQQGLGAVERLAQVTSLRIEEDVGLAGGEVADGVRSTDPIHVVIDDVSFAYPGRPAVLRGLSLEVPRHRVTALVGPSGAGKSTVLALLQRFYEPTGGTIRLDGCDIADMSRAEVRARLGWVDQDATVLPGSIAENLSLGRPDATDEEMAEVLAAVRLDSFVDGLSGRVATAVGERGGALSGGERQRLAVARALLRKPEVMLLDEASSQLDTANEVCLREVLARISRTTTVIVIAHRLTTVRGADRIAVIRSGRVVDVGSHEELFTTSDSYRLLASAGFGDD